MVSCAYLRRQAALCLRIAAAIDDQRIVAALVVMADDFSAKADEVDPSFEPKSVDPKRFDQRSLDQDSPSVVMPGLVPGTHVFRATKQGVGGRDIPGTKCPGAGHDALGDSKRTTL